MLNRLLLIAGLRQMALDRLAECLPATTQPAPSAGNIAAIATQAALDYGLPVGAIRGLIDSARASLAAGTPAGLVLTEIRQQALRQRASLGPALRAVATNANRQKVPQRQRIPPVLLPPAPDGDDSQGAL